MSFLDFCFSSNWEREREREWYTKFGYKGEIAQNYLSYFSTGFHWRIFLLSRANRLYSFFFYTGLKNLGSLVSQIFFCLQPVYGSSARHEPCSKTFLLFTSAEGKESPLPFWGPSQSFGFSLPPLPVSGDLRLLSTNTCWYPLCDPHSLLTVTFLTGFHCSFQREDSINLTSIVSPGYHVTIFCSKVFNNIKAVTFINQRTIFEDCSWNQSMGISTSIHIKYHLSLLSECIYFSFIQLYWPVLSTFDFWNNIKKTCLYRLIDYCCTINYAIKREISNPRKMWESWKSNNEMNCWKYLTCSSEVTQKLNLETNPQAQSKYTF